MNNKIVRGLVGAGGVKLFSIPLTILVSIILARGLGSDDYGEYIFTVSLISLLALPVGPGFGQFITRETAKFDQDNDIESCAGLWVLSLRWVVVSSFLVAFLALVFLFLFLEEAWDGFFISLLIIPLMGVNAIRTNILRGWRFPVLSQIPELLVFPVTQMALAWIVLNYSGLSIVSSIAIYLIALMASAITGYIFLNIKKPGLRISKGRFDKINFSVFEMLPFFLLSVVNLISSQSGILLLGWFGTSSDVSAFKVAQNAAALVLLSLTIVNMVIAPHVVKAYKNNDIGLLKKVTVGSSRLALGYSFPLAIIFVLFGSDIVGFVYGGEYSVIASGPLLVLVFGQVFNVICGSSGLILIMGGNERETLKGQMFAVATAVFSMFIMIPIYGAVGAALGMVLGIVVFNVTLSVKVKAKYGFWPTAFSSLIVR